MRASVRQLKTPWNPGVDRTWDDGTSPHHEGHLVALEDLDLIFDTIRGKTKSVAVVLTPHVLKRTESDRGFGDWLGD